MAEHGGGGGALRELLVFFGIEVEQEKLEVLEEGLGGIIEKAKHATAAFGAFLAFGELKEFFEGTIEMVTELEHMSARLGVTTDELQHFQFAARLAGVDAAGAGVSLRFLTKNIGEAVIGGGEAAETFHKLGVHLKGADGQVRSTEDIIFELADGLEKLPSHQVRAAYAMKLFGRAGQQMLPILEQGKDKIHETYKELDDLGGLMDEEFIKTAAEARNELEKMHVAFTGLRVRAVQIFLPQVRKLVDLFTDAAKVLQNVVQHTHALQHAFELIKGIGIIATLVQIYGWLKKIAIVGLIDAAPWLLWAAGIGLVYLAIDDLLTLMEGGESVIGDALGPDKQAFVDTMKGSVDALKDAWAAMQPLIPALGEAFKNVFPIVLKSVISVVLALVSLGQVLATVVESVVKIPEAIKKGDFEVIGRVIDKGIGGASKTSDAIGALWTSPPNVPAPTVAEVPGTGTGRRETQGSSVVQHNNIRVEVTGSNNGDVQAVGKAVGDGVRDALERQKLDALNSVKRK